jgi:hypothetical protein
VQSANYNLGTLRAKYIDFILKEHIVQHAGPQHSLPVKVCTQRPCREKSLSTYFAAVSPAENTRDTYWHTNCTREETDVHNGLTFFFTQRAAWFNCCDEEFLEPGLLWPLPITASEDWRSRTAFGASGISSVLSRDANLTLWETARNRSRRRPGRERRGLDRSA